MHCMWNSLLYVFNFAFNSNLLILYVLEVGFISLDYVQCFQKPIDPDCGATLILSYNNDNNNNNNNNHWSRLCIEPRPVRTSSTVASQSGYMPSYLIDSTYITLARPPAVKKRKLKKRKKKRNDYSCRPHNYSPPHFISFIHFAHSFIQSFIHT